MQFQFFFFYSLVDYATGNVCANFHGDCAIDGRDLRGGVDSTPPPATEQPKKPGLVRVNHVMSCTMISVRLYILSLDITKN